MLMRPWCRDHTYTVIWTEGTRTEERGLVMRSLARARGSADRAAGVNIVHVSCLTRDKGYNFRTWGLFVYIDSFRIVKGDQLHSTDLERCYSADWGTLLWPCMNPSTGAWRARLEFSQMWKNALNHELWSNRSDSLKFSPAQLQYSWLVQSCGDNKCINDKISLERGSSVCSAKLIQ